VIIDHRVYRTLPGRLPAQLELYSKLGYPVQLRYMGEPHYYLTTETRAKMAQDPDWKTYLAENAKAGHIIEQNNWLTTPVPFAPKIPPAKIVK
jgi:hypothetical protein